MEEVLSLLLFFDLSFSQSLSRFRVVVVLFPSSFFPLLLLLFPLTLQGSFSIRRGIRRRPC